MTKGELREFAKRNGLTLSEARERVRETKAPLHSEGVDRFNAERTSDHINFFVVATEMRGGRCVARSSIKFHITKTDIQALPKPKNSKDDIGSAIVDVFRRGDHMVEKYLPNLIIEYYKHTQTLANALAMGLTGIAMKVIYEGKNFVICPGEVGSTYDDIETMAIRFEQNDPEIVDILTRSVFGHMPRVA